MSAAQVPFQFLNAGFTIKDPGTGKTIPLKKGIAVCPITIAASASETRYLPTPRSAGLILGITAAVVGSGGTCTFAALSSGTLANTTLTGFTFNAAGQTVYLISVISSVSGTTVTYKWARMSLADFPQAVVGSLYQTYVPLAAQQAVSGTGVTINLTSYRTNWTTTGASQTATLANGSQVGHLKRIQNTVDGGSGILTPTSLSGGTTITFTNAGDYCLLGWNGTAWVAIELGNDADGATAAVLA